MYEANVLDYIKNKDQSPLFFYNERVGRKYGINHAKTMPLGKLIMEILVNSRRFPSYNTKMGCETRSNKWRSSLDIWRHVIWYQPNYTILDVMKELWELHKELVGHYCPTVRRRVFKARKQFPAHTLDTNKYRDEYGMYLYQWTDTKNTESV